MSEDQESASEPAGLPLRGATRAVDVLGVGLFLLALWLPLIASFGERGGRISKIEQRSLAELPELDASWQSLASLPDGLEAWHDDHMGLRNPLIRGHAWLSIELFRRSPSEKLIVGKEGWLFFGDERAIAHYRGVAPLDEGQLREWTRALEERQDWLAERGVAYLLVLVPDKHLMYAEYMPDNLPRASDTHPLDQLSRHLADHSRLTFIDLREPLQAAKRRERIYHRTDSHWNDVGAYTAYSAILRRLGQLVPGLAGREPVAVERRVRDVPGMGLAGIVGLAPIYHEELIELTPIAPRARVKPEHRSNYDERVRTLQPIALGNDERSLPRAVMFRDSFANALVPYLSEDFQRILYVWSRDIDPRIVAIEQPDVVIQQVVGRFLSRRPRRMSELLAEPEPGRFDPNR